MNVLRMSVIALALFATSLVYSRCCRPRCCNYVNEVAYAVPATTYVSEVEVAPICNSCTTRFLGY